MRICVGRTDSCGILYEKNVTGMLQKHVQYCANDDISSYQGLENSRLRAIFPTRILEFIRTCYEKVKSNVTGSRCSGKL